MPTIDLPKPHPAQDKVLDERKRFNVLACGRRWGKTKLGGNLAIEAAATHRQPVGWFAPTYKYLDDAVREINSRLVEFGPAAKYNQHQKRIDFAGSGSIEFWSTEPDKAGTESTVARGRKYARIIYDEAAHARRLKADWTRAIRPTLADYRGDAWFLSTPHGMDYFHQLYLRGQHGEEGWASWQMPTSANPHIAPEEIESARRELPADAFEQEYLAQFLANAANPFRIDAIRACIIHGVCKGPVCWWGVDLAKSHDWTVAIGLNERGGVCAFERWQSDWRATGARLAAMLRNAPALVDSTGVGNPIVEELQAKTGTVEGYVFSARSKQNLMEGLAYAIQNKTVQYPQSILVDELESFQYEYHPGGVRYTSPDGSHDDCVCALALAVQCRGSHVPVTFDRGYGGPEVDRYASDYSPIEDEALWITN